MDQSSGQVKEMQLDKALEKLPLSALEREYLRDAKKKSDLVHVDN
jgi:hypothetical protein